jgi:hypothetical protein
MPVITGIQRRAPDAHSTQKYASYDDFVESAEFAVRRQSRDGENVEISVFFPRSGTPERGVGLSLPSLEVAIAVGRALLTVAEGQLTEMVGRF